MRKIVLALDSYKGCLSSEEVETCVAEALRERFPECEIKCVPMSDGGEGLLDALKKLLDIRIEYAPAYDPLMRKKEARYGILPDGETVVIEMAEINGLPLLSKKDRNPMKTTTFGTGEVILDALSHEYYKFLIGVGGSATNDAGMGMLEDLGVCFLDDNGRKLTASGEAMCKISSMDLTCFERMLSSCTFKVACDVMNPFCGPEGAAYMFASQKGATPEQVKELDEGMNRFADVISKSLGKEVRYVPGAGAAGGLGGACWAFLNAELVSGIDLILDLIDFEKELEDADLVITGEGKSDIQTLLGKVSSGVLKRTSRLNVPTLLLSGKIENQDALLHAGFDRLVEVSPENMPLSEAMKPEVAKENLRRAIRELSLS